MKASSGHFISTKPTGYRDTHITTRITNLFEFLPGETADDQFRPSKKTQKHLLVVFGGNRVRAMVITASSIITAPMMVNLPAIEIIFIDLYENH